MIRLWRWLCCLTGHHRETVTTDYYSPCGWLGVDFLWFKCLDCGHTTKIAAGVRFTPSRRYALRRQRAA